MEVTETELPGVLIISPRAFADDRGFFKETWHQTRYADAGLPETFVQDNHSFSSKHVLRGLHSQITHPQGKLVGAVTGTIWDVAVNVDPTSSHFKKWVGVELSGDNHKQLYVPPGFLHGFVVLSDTANVTYKCTDLYTPGDELGVMWNDPDIAIDWPVSTPKLSAADEKNPTLAAYLKKVQDILN